MTFYTGLFYILKKISESQMTSNSYVNYYYGWQVILGGLMRMK